MNKRHQQKMKNLVALLVGMIAKTKWMIFEKGFEKSILLLGLLALPPPRG